MSAGKRFGGAYSPGGAPGRPPKPKGASPWSSRSVERGSLRALGLFLWPTPLALGAALAILGGDPQAMLERGGAYLLLILGAGLTRTGLTAAAAYEARAVARPPAFPRKLFGAAMTGLGVGLAAGTGGLGLVAVVVFGAAAAGLHVAAFGPDPMRAKGVDGLEGDALDAAITKIETARALLTEMRDAAAGFGDRALQDRVATLAATAEEVVAALERDPRDMRRARRFLAVYLVGARDATVKFAKAWDENRDGGARAEYAALLDDLDTHFTEHRAALMQDDRTALDVEIEVLRDRLRMEGV